MSSAPARTYPRVYRALLSHSEPLELGQARVAANPYQRPSLIAAFDAGWFGWRFRQQLGDGFTAPHLSKLGRSAWLRGHAARAAHEADNPTLEDL